MDLGVVLCYVAWSVALAIALVIMVPVVVILKPLLYIYVTPKGRRAKRLIDAIPGPPHLPVLGNALDIWVSRERILEYRNDNCRKYYPLYKLWYLGVFMIDPVGPECVEAILRSSKHIEKGWVYDLLRPWLGNGLLTSKGEKWFSHRKFLTPAFHFKILEEFVPMFVDRSAELARKLAAKAESGEPFDVVPVISQCTLEVICESAMGIKLDREKKEQRDYIAAIYRFGEVLYERAITPWYAVDWVFGLTPLGREHKRILQVLHSFSENVIKSKKMEYIRNKTSKAPTSGTSDIKPGKKKLRAFLELLIELAVEERLLTDEEIREEVDTFMFEGHDTTSMAICYTIFMLANHPKIQEEVWKEVQFSQSGGATGGSNVESMGELQLLERCIKETLRMYPSVPYIARLLAEDLEMGDYTIPANTMINVAITGIHMNSSVFPDPETFDPDRFLPEEVKSRHPYAYIPFSAGPRNCIGQRFAMLEMKAVLSALIKNYRIVAVDKPEDIQLMHDIVLRSNKGIRIKLEPRENKSWPSQTSEPFKMESLLTSILMYSMAACVAILMLPVLLIMGPVIISYITTSGRRTRELINKIHGPPTFAFMGNAAAFFVSRKGILQYRKENCEKYFPVYRLWYFQQPMVNVVGPEYVEAILHSSKHIEKGWVYKFMQPWLGDGLLTSGGDKWFSHRKFLTPTFHFKILEEFVTLYAESSTALAEKLSVEASSGEAFDIVSIVSQCTLEIICESAMGIKLDAKDESQKKYMMAIKEFGEIFYNRIAKPWYGIDFLFKLTPLYRQQEKVLKILHDFTERVIKDKKEEYLRNKASKEKKSKGDSKVTKKKVKAFLELLIELSEEKNELTDEEIREEVDTFMFEGHDTTSMAISWTIFMLANHPDIQQDVWHEIESKFAEHAAESGDGSFVPTAKIYNDLQLLERCIKETLRMYPSVPFISRVLTTDFQMENYEIPSGTMVNVVISGIHMNPRVYPNPEVFDPDRFLPDVVKTRHPYAYVPFSAGPRNCIGQRFAMLEVKSVLCSILRHYKLIPVDTPKDISFMHDLVLRPCNGIKIKLEKR
ncbi:uncharacterized protein LOC124153250 [Ischnura elegans]|uniref:uncharacterized protein LOC124153250 n=1 Tax=Ischnura elegans TaxID=197161 RepID=UPI001ED8ACBB|nr:uncharacterized protein LOC124153250 [Ischnura elegans]